MKFISSFFSRTNGVLSEGMGFYSLTELYHDSVRDDEELFYNVSPTVSIHNFQKGSCKRKRGFLIRNFEEQVLDEALNERVLETIRRQPPFMQVTFQMRNLRASNKVGTS